MAQDMVCMSMTMSIGPSPSESWALKGILLESRSLHSVAISELRTEY